MGKLNYTEHEKRCAFIIDQLSPIISERTGYVGPDTFDILTARLAEILPEDPAQKDGAAGSASVRLLETVADIAWLAGAKKYHGGDSREDISRFIEWAKEFEGGLSIDQEGNQTYYGDDYMIAIEKFALARLEGERQINPTDGAGQQQEGN